MTNSTNNYKESRVCPKCNAMATPWGNDFWVCDACGYGKVSGEKI